MPDTQLLKLRAMDSEDVKVISAVLQDAIVPVCDMEFQAENKNFVIVSQRLRRENADQVDRICCALTIRGVTSVQTQGIDLRSHDRILDLLAIMINDATPGPGAVLSLVFAGDAKIRLELASWSALAEDFGEPWPAMCNPCHDSPSIAS
jgi:hypothetical protein